jgi:flagellar hook protein FlgE
MGLGTVMQTALAGMNAAQVSIQVAANNLANLNTPGFKASRVHLATLPQAFSPGGGSPLVVGGVQVVGIDADFASGALDPFDDQPAVWTLQGEGLFILEGEGGQRLYTRDGHFHFNADGELVTADGWRVLGFQADADGRIDTSELKALRVASGSAADAGADGPATLQRFTVSRDGRLLGHFSDGTRRVVGQLRLARFANPSGLAQRGGNNYSATPASGAPQEVTPGTAGAAEVIGGAAERSNTDLGRELIELTLAGNLFRANLAVFYTADALLDELYLLRR